MKKGLALVCSLVGVLFACAGLLLFWFSVGSPDGNGKLSLEDWVVLLFLISLSIGSFVAAWQLWRSDSLLERNTLGRHLLERELWSLWAFMFGSGILVFIVGLFSELYSWQYGLIGMIACWVISFALRTFLSTKRDD